jgi:hypothetical protein
MKNKLTIFFFSSLFLLSCKKDSGKNELNLAYQMISEKIWYLSYSQTITSTKTTEKNYVGQSTYFIKFLKDYTSVDSDGLKGVYNLEKTNDVLQIHVNAKTQGQNTIEYIYNIESLGASNMILYSTVAGVTNKFYYDTNH